jgi:hypothetical protein
MDKARAVAVLVASLLVVCPAEGAPAPLGAPPKGWRQLFKGRLVAVHVQEALYDEGGKGSFLLAIRVTNLTRERVGLDLRDRFLLRPNQWGVLNGPRREIVDERRTALPPLNDKAKNAVTAAHQAGKLTILRPGQALTFYRQFNNRGSRSDVARDKGTHLFVSVSGRLLVTDGRGVEQVNCSWGGASQESDVIVPWPVPWRSVPKAALIVPR